MKCNVALFLFTFCCHFATTMTFSRADYPDSPRAQMVEEYEVDPAWPKRPDRIQPLGAVSGIAVDKEDHVWVYNRGEDPVQVYSAEGDFIRTWGKGVIGSPHQLRIDPQGNIWVTDIGLHVVHQFTPEGKLLKTFGTKGEKGEDQSHFFAPTDVAVTPAGDAFISDGYGNRRIVHFDKDGKFIKTWGTFGSEPGDFVLPHSIVLGTDGRLYVADRSAGRIQIFNQEGKFLDQWDQVMMPWGLASLPNGDIWACGSTPYWWRRGAVASPLKDQILFRFAPNGRVRQVWGIPLGEEGHTKPGQCNGVHCLARDSKDNLYLGDVFGNRAQKFIVAESPPSAP